MKGKLVKTDKGWEVFYTECVPGRMVMEWSSSLPLHPDDVNEINAWEQVFDNVDARIANNQDVDFHFHEIWEEVDGKTKVTKTAKLGPVPTDENNYPLTQGTMDICNEIINNREISDEEIQKEANRIHGMASIAFEEGAKWYREKLKQKRQ